MLESLTSADVVLATNTGEEGRPPALRPQWERAGWSLPQGPGGVCVASSLVLGDSPMKPSGPGVCFVERFLTADPASFIDVGMVRFSLPEGACIFQGLCPLNPSC